MKLRDIEMGDIEGLIKLMKEFAIFDGSSDDINIDAKKLSNAFFSDNPKLFGLIVEEENQAIGFLNYTFKFSSFQLTNCLWVEDVYIQEDYRNKGIGVALFNKVKSIAVANDCNRLEWFVRKDNKKGQQFYNRLGAKIDETTMYMKWSL